MDTNQYLEIFIDESKEHLQAMSEHLLELEKDPENIAIVNEIFRSAHTLKGMSATMGYEDLANLTHKLENVLDAIRNHQISVSLEIMDTVFSSVDDLEAMVEDIAAGGDGKRDVSAIVEKLLIIEQGEAAAAVEAPEAPMASQPAAALSYDEFEWTVINQSKEQGFTCLEIAVSLRADCVLKAARVFMVFEVLEKCGEVIKSSPSSEQLEEEKFDETFTVTLITKEPAGDIGEKIKKVSEVERVQVTEITSVTEPKMKPASSPPAAPQPKLDSAAQEAAKKQPAEAEKGEAKSPKQAASNKTIRVNIERLDILMNLFEELVIDRGRLESISAELNHTELNETVERMSRISGDLQNIILNMRMVPVETVFNRFPKLVRQLSRDLGKQINLEIIGAETELDRTVIDEIGDPLVHLIRNAGDHGIEMPEVRLSKGKPAEGTIKLKAYHSGNHVFIEIEDDGAGINKDRVLQKALDKGIVTEEQALGMTDRQIFELIMASGFSTAEVISDLSGRGVGLDVVKTTIESLGGSITIDSQEGAGSIFSIQLPLTLSIISVMLVEAKKEKYAIPLSSIIETAIVKKEDIMNAHNQQVIDFRGKVVPLLFLKDIFSVPHEEDDDRFYSVVLVRKGEKMAGLVVDSFIGQQEVVLKSLGNYLSNVFAISGATILGDGQVALIVDCNALIK
ncbi:chemotaxis protein CheA [Domibacillus sp. DTU_2020_1001157_1_SI_ALB_TIR_016]|uniref:chemotaxis protein CheA n=1 Tax=Domibacillus sp. DTU_2020_1001157_1_SI_ALB_TIR_016 TaxID=3077789 RepID=UPI0028E8D706|nr:chemotaxis protein CheA [Domibacillus sp. DTU_2020_1001157_1_SI_ALB_TIR_016]WNS79708.1 chemotaxis protein CheA [Domibacillus sp. DTU_2020_1001157_1_SI_ALB_TIR_016]